MSINPISPTFSALCTSTANTLVVLSDGSWTSVAVNQQIGCQTLVGVNDVTTGSGNDTIFGNNNGGILDGGAGNDIIRGGSGNDVLIGGTGNDRLTSRDGNDMLVFRPGFGHDIVTDFNVGNLANHDTLDLRGLGFSSIDDVLNHTDLGSIAVIHVGASDITLYGVNKAQLSANPHDILI